MSVKPENFTGDVRQNKKVLKELAGFITGHIQKRSAPTSGWDFRFLVIVAQWLIEQGRYTMTPEGNNPGNVVGKGDASPPSFFRPYNKEYNRKTGQYELRPDVPFANYSSMDYATNRKFDHLQHNWPLSYQAVIIGLSSEAYGRGLFLGKPGGHGDYATASPVEYVRGLRWRLLQHVMPHYIATCEDDIKEMDESARLIPGRTPVSGESLDYRNSLELNKNTRGLLEGLLKELKEVEKRIKAGEPIQKQT